jgi:hypothetical protein
MQYPPLLMSRALYLGGTRSETRCSHKFRHVVMVTEPLPGFDGGGQKIPYQLCLLLLRLLAVGYISMCDDFSFSPAYPRLANQR